MYIARHRVGLSLVLVLAYCQIPLAETEPYYLGRAGGWFWYQEPVKQSEEDLAVPTPAPETPAEPAYRQQLAIFKEELEEALARAVMEPEPEHLRHYMTLNARSLALAGRFAEAWQWVLQQRPELDYRLQYPASDQAVQSVNYYHAVDRDARLRQLSDEHGLLFMFRGDCPVCHRFAPVLLQFAKQYGFSILAVSLDGGTLPGLSQVKMDNGIASRLNVDLVPALFLVAPRQREFKAVGYGYMSSAALGQQLLLASEDWKLHGDGR